MGRTGAGLSSAEGPPSPYPKRHLRLVSHQRARSVAIRLKIRHSPWRKVAFWHLQRPFLRSPDVFQDFFSTTGHKKRRQIKCKSVRSRKRQDKYFESEWAASNPSHDADGFGGEEARVAHFIVHYAVEDLLLIVTRERRLKDTNAHYFTYCTCMTWVSVSWIYFSVLDLTPSGLKDLQLIFISPLWLKSILIKVKN